MDKMDLLKQMKDRMKERNLTQQPLEHQEFDTRYQYSYVPMPIVEANIEEYIIPELQDACKSLWARNIFTFMCSNRNDGGAAYIILEALSDENKVIWDKLQEKHPKNFRYNSFRRANSIRIDDVTSMSEEEISNEFMKLSKHFKPQDVQSLYYKSPEEYLVDCGCCDEIPNPEYEDPGTFRIPDGVELTDIEAIRKAMIEYDKKCEIPETIKTFNKNKMTKTFEEYVRDNGDEDKLDATTGNVYRSSYFLNKHLDYVQSQKQEKIQEKDL